LIADFIKNKVHGGDEYEVYKLMSLVEQYKRLYNDNALKNDWISVLKSKNTELELSGLINSLNEDIKNLSKLQDHSIIEAMMEKIADDAIEKLAYHRVDNMKQVIFTGRGFMMKSFKDKMMEKLKDSSSFSPKPSSEEKNFFDRRKRMFS
jgi:predicted RND superfamily exporter protein